MGITYKPGENSTSGSGRAMGLFYGFDTACFKRKYRWMFTLRGVAGDPNPSSNMLPPSKASRPNLTFKEIEAQHLSETVYFPGKPDWKPISITLYDIANSNTNSVYDYIKKYYNAENGRFGYSNDLKIPQADLQMYSGCGTIIENWVFENVWPQQIEFGELDMAESGVVTVDLTLRYDRAYTQVYFDSFNSANDSNSSSAPDQLALPQNLTQPDLPTGDILNPFGLRARQFRR